jgi:hypothetical protein
VSNQEAAPASTRAIGVLTGWIGGLMILGAALQASAKAPPYLIVIPIVLMALRLAFVLIGTGWPVNLAWLAVAGGLALIPLVAADIDPAQGANDHAGCGSVLDPTPILLAPADLRVEAMRECVEVLERQERTALLLTLPAAFALVGPPLRGAANRLTSGETATTS